MGQRKSQKLEMHILISSFLGSQPLKVRTAENSHYTEVLQDLLTNKKIEMKVINIF